ncbi:MAG: adenylate/guanylate cyclase domain-containing protein [Actinomycetota bacterium]|nr:adenylate/guanylate cyclase domain-containing protein [Actinomycetota bacterium]
MQPETRYTRSLDGVAIAYQVLGEGTRDLVLAPGWIFHIEVVWEHPAFESFMRRLTGTFRVIMFDKRGTGLSDRSVVTSTMEERMDDLRAVMDAVGSEKASIMGWSEGANIAAMFAATYPQRVEGLILYAGAARYQWAPDYPIGFSDEILEAARDIFCNHWGEGRTAYIAAPSRADDEAFRRWFGRYERMTVSPGGAEVMLEANLAIDTTEMLKLVRNPTLVLHNIGDQLVPVEASRYIAEKISGSKHVELGGDDHLFWFSNADEVVGEIEQFLLGSRSPQQQERVLATVLFTDIVSSTEQADAMGDARWREMLDAHERLTREELGHFRGDLIETTGDGVLATFDGPARAVLCATRLCSRMDRGGLQLRAGVHTGEIELRGDHIGGLAVHIAARVMSVASAGEVVTSRTVKDLAVGAGIDFVDKGPHQLKGLTEPWDLFTAKV